MGPGTKRARVIRTLALVPLCPSFSLPPQKLKDKKCSQTLANRRIIGFSWDAATLISHVCLRAMNLLSYKYRRLPSPKITQTTKRHAGTAKQCRNLWVPGRARGLQAKVPKPSMAALQSSRRNGGLLCSLLALPLCGSLSQGDQSSHVLLCQGSLSQAVRGSHSQTHLPLPRLLPPVTLLPLPIQAPDW